ncbi:MAG: glycosyl hydrolase [Kiritimatiellaceae bacterium]|nr:glycosyl hydrolase [Kiritimatiellaceae bacterium]
MKKAAFTEVPLAEIRPGGWIQRWLEIQKHGLTGHLEVAGFPFASKLWACKHIAFQYGEPWWPYEQTAYWIDGFTRCGYLLDDPELMKKTREQVDYVLKHADPDGYLGPKGCKKPMPAGRWSHSIFFRAMIAHFYATGDQRIIPALKKHYLCSAYDYAGGRDVCNVEIMCWLYGQTGESKLLAMAEEAYQEYDRTAKGPERDLRASELKKDTPATIHGVTFIETVKQGSILYMYTGNRRYLQPSVNGFRKLDRHHMLIDGVPSSHEELHGKSPKDVHETCDIADYAWSAGYLLMATGHTDFADKIERACFNAAPGAVTPDFKALQYFSGPNQVVLNKNSSHSLSSAGGQWMCYRPKPGTECCTGQINRVMPCYVSRMWMQKDGNPAAVLYGPGSYSFKSGRQDITITQETNYPFGEEIDFLFRMNRPAKFTFWLRIPGWCRNAKILINGKPLKRKLTAGTMTGITRLFAHTDRITLVLPMELNRIDWIGGGVAIERGPLLYSLKIEEDRRIDSDDPNQTKEFPAYVMFPKSSWNYALSLDKKPLSEQIEVQLHAMTSEPWTNPPVSLRVPAKKIKGWTLSRPESIPATERALLDPVNNIWGPKRAMQKGDYLMTPDLPDEKTVKAGLSKKEELITLVPYGCTQLRLTLFPSDR